MILCQHVKFHSFSRLSLYQVCLTWTETDSIPDTSVIITTPHYLQYHQTLMSRFLSRHIICQ